MAVYSIERPVPLGAIAIFRVVDGFEHAIARLRAWRNARGTESALRKLSDQQLADIGLHRGDIAVLAETLARR
jgi:uncharacterized protein YjiS (DUF1127 family)